MIVVFRVDASQVIGIGHVMRCLTLADELADQQVTPVFICLRQDGDMISHIAAKGYLVHVIEPMDAHRDFDWKYDCMETKRILTEYAGRVDWLIIDHYQISDKWETEISSYAERIVVIDDLANRKHFCHLLLDQNYYKNLESRYNQLVPASCKLLLGPANALLRREFYLQRSLMQPFFPRSGCLKRLLIFFGGSDPNGDTEKTMNAVMDISHEDWIIDVVVGNSNPRREQIQDICKQRSYFHFHCQVTNMAELMRKADLSIGAGGTATWERLFLGLPSMTLIVAENQREMTEVLADEGYIWSLGHSNEASPSKIKQFLLEMISNPDIIQKLSARGYQFMDQSAVQTYSTLTRAIVEGI